MRIITTILLSIILFDSPAGGAALKSSAHFGMSMEESSSLGFKKSIGSTMFFDVTRPFSHGIEIGLRSIGSDGIGADSRFYRLGVGPLLAMEVYANWHLQLAPFFFQESGSMFEGDQKYRSKGNGILIGWERSFAMTERVFLCWGGFITRHWGSMKLQQGTAPPQTAQASWVDATRNDGGSRGVEIALRMSL